MAGGYWASKKLFSAAAELSAEEERDCRTYYETHPVRSSGVPYSQARTVYVLGYVAGRNPEYAGRGYADVEPHLRGGYTGKRAGSYDTLRDFGQRGYERGSTLVTSNLPFDEWTEVMGSERLTGALLDRLTHHVHILEMNGESYRLAQSKRRRRAVNSAADTRPTAAQ